MIEKKICVQCFEPWELNECEKKWFINKGLVAPTRCDACRAKNRAEKETQNLREGGMETT